MAGQKILVTGGAGFIGSHTVVELLTAGYEVVVIDNLSNSSAVALERVRQITRRTLEFVEGDIRDGEALESIFREHTIDSVIHFAGLKAVGESVAQPLKYYDNNVYGTLVLLEVMQRMGIRNFVFSSSATVYGEPERVPITEDFPLNAVNPYGRTKLVVEEMLRDLGRSCSDLNIILLRYFNPVGAHPSGLIGEDPNDIPNNLVPYISQVAIGKLDCLQVFGSDYSTPDGTGVRDYIHVVDLALGHLAALKRLALNPGVEAINLGTGKGYSVLEMVEAFERAADRKIPYKIVDRRPGDAAICFADPVKAKRLLGWQATRDIDAMVRDSWHWQSQNPNGYSA